jgi:hypothetical protein
LGSILNVAISGVVMTRVQYARRILDILSAGATWIAR